MLTAHIIAVMTGNEPHALRAAAEWWDMAVTMTWVGNSRPIVDFCANQPPHDFIIFSAHGDERGLILPELGAEIAHLYPYLDAIRPEEFDQFLHLNNNTVLNLSCMGGSQALAAVFLAHGARHYIGAVGYPDGNAALMYALDFLYNCVRQKSVAEAHRIASQHDDDRRQFQLYSQITE